jgi:hypothetical protein
MRKVHWFAVALVLLVPLLAAPVTVAVGNPIGNRFVIRNNGSVPELNAAVAYNNQSREYLVVWQNEWSSSKDIYGQRVAWNGALVGPWFAISPAGDDRYNPDVAYDGQHNEYLVVWERWWGTQLVISGQRVSATGQLLGSEFDIASIYDYYYHEPHVDYAYSGTSGRYLVAFRYDWGSEQGVQARDYYWSGSSNVLGTTFEVVSSTVSAPDHPDLAYNRSRNEFLVAWQETYAVDDHDIYARRVKMTGGTGVQGSVFPVTTSTNDDITPAVAAIPTVPDEGQYLVAWESSADVKARTVTGTGSLGTMRTLADTAWSEHSPAVAGCESSKQFLAVWVWVPVVTPPAMMQIQRRTLALDGTLLDQTTTVGGGQVYAVAVAAGPVGDFLIAFDDNEVIGVSNRGIYGYLLGNRVYLPLVMKS